MIADIKTHMETKMDQSIAAFKNNLQRIRTGRPSPALLDTIHVDYYGSMVPLSQVANVQLLDARTLSVQPWEKNMSAKIEKAIRESELGLNPASMGDIIRVPMPAMSEERRKEMTKLARNEAEGAKIAVRNLRRDANESVKKLVKDKQVSEDDQKRAEAETQKVTDKHIATIDSLVLGFGFLSYAWRMYRKYSDALAQKTFPYSIIYLSILFAALLVDHYFKFGPALTQSAAL